MQADDKLRDAALSVLRRIFGEANVPHPKAIAVSRWASEEFSRGTYFVGL